MDFVADQNYDVTTQTPETTTDYIKQHGISGFGQLVNSCIRPTIAQTIQTHLMMVIIINILTSIYGATIRYNTQNVKLQVYSTAVMNIFGGIFLILWQFRPHPTIPLIAVASAFVGTIFVYLYGSSPKNVWQYCIFLILENETMIFVFGYKNLIALRALNMLVFMKLITLNTTINRNRWQNVNYTFIEMLSYILHPQTLPFGGWHPFVSFESTRVQKPTNRRKPQTPKLEVTLDNRFGRFGYSICVAILFLITSTCLIDYIVYLFHDQISNSYMIEFVHAFFVSMQFRTSHYFISYTLQSIFSIWWYHIQIVNPFSVEFPRSMVSAAVAWNRPMSDWLKYNCYLPLTVKSGHLKARLLTFVLSAYMHGLNFQIWICLVTLGLITYVECRFRRKLSRKFSCCCEAKSCTMVAVHNDKRELDSLEKLKLKLFTFIRLQSNQKWRCKRGHINTELNSICVNLINLLFTILSISHLIFIGSGFDSTPQSMTFQHVYKIWSKLAFYSYFITILMAIITYNM